MKSYWNNEPVFDLMSRIIGIDSEIEHSFHLPFLKHIGLGL